MKTYKLNDGFDIPVLGLGTWMIRPSQFQTVIDESIKNGITYFDVAQQYNNETLLGNALKENGIARKECFISTKVWISNFHDRETFMKSIRQSLSRLQTDYVDLLLLHWPRQKSNNVKVYKWLIEAREKGLTRSIGLSNFGAKTITKLIKVTGVVPATNHLEVQIPTQQKENVDFCIKNNILVQPYSTLRPYLKNESFTLNLVEMNEEEKALVEQIGKKYNKTGPQIILRWLHQKGFQLFPRMTTTDMIKQNTSIFDFKLTLGEMKSLNECDRNEYETIDSVNHATNKLLEASMNSDPFLYENFFKQKLNGKIVESTSKAHEKQLLKIEKYFKMAKK